MQYIYRVDFSLDTTRIKILSKKDLYNSTNKIKEWIISTHMKLYYKVKLKTRLLKR